jgi:acyl carrier protein
MNDLTIAEALEALTEVSGIDDIDPEEKFRSLDLDSLMVIDWISAVEGKLGVDFDTASLDMSGLGDLGIREVIELLYRRVIAA